MNKKANNVSDLLKNVGASKSLKENVEKEIQKRSLSKFLFALRCEHKLTQKEIATKIGCSQSRISKIETSYDDEITIKDLMDYGKALNLQLEMGYRARSVKIVDLIKYHAFKIKNYLEDLTKLAGDDESLSQSILSFHKEALINIVKFISDSGAKLNIVKKKKYSNKSEPVHISSPIEAFGIGKNEDKTITATPV